MMIDDMSQSKASLDCLYFTDNFTRSSTLLSTQTSMAVRFLPTLTSLCAQLPTSIDNCTVPLDGALDDAADGVLDGAPTGTLAGASAITTSNIVPGVALATVAAAGGATAGVLLDDLVDIF